VFCGSSVESVFLAGTVQLRFRGVMVVYPRVLFMVFLQRNIVAIVYIQVVLCSEHIIPAVTKLHNAATWTAGARLWW